MRRPITRSAHVAGPRGPGPCTVLRNIGQGVLGPSRFVLDSDRRLHDGKVRLTSPTFASWIEADRFVREHGAENGEYILVRPREVPPNCW